MDENEKKGGAAAMRPLDADDVWIMTDIIGKVGLWDIVNALPADLVKKSRFKAPTMMEKGKIVEMPRDKWTDRQIDAETDAEIAKNQLVMSILAAVMQNLGKCRDDVNKLLAKAIGSEENEIRKMPAVEYVRTVNAFMDREEFSDFFSEALKLVETFSKSKMPLSGATGMQTA